VGGGDDISLTLGVDLAAQNKQTVACLIDWADGGAVVREPITTAATDEKVDWLVDIACPRHGPAPDAIGIDAPFGWPVEMLGAITAWSAGQKWPSPEKLDFRFRATDVEVHARTGGWPLSVSSDRIAVTALRCVSLLDGIAGRRGLGGKLSRVGDDGVYEVYPGAALTRWGLTRAGYKSSGNAAKHAVQRRARAALISELEQRAITDAGIRWLNLDAARDQAIASDDVLDAIIASLVARAAAIDETEWPRDYDPPLAERAEVEGWIHLPNEDCLGRLAQS